MYQQHNKQVLSKVIWEEHVAILTSDNALSYCMCLLYNVQHYKNVMERYWSVMEALQNAWKHYGSVVERCRVLQETLRSILCHSLNSLLGTLSFTLMPHIHLTILMSARWSATLLSFLTGQVSLP